MDFVDLYQFVCRNTARYRSVSASYIFGSSSDITLIHTKSKTFNMNTVDKMSVNCLQISL